MPQFPFSTNHLNRQCKAKGKKAKNKEVPKVFYDLKRCFAATAAATPTRSEDDDEAACRKF